MWQEIIVGLAVALAAGFVGLRLWKSFAATDSGKVDCTCGCKGCDAASGQCDTSSHR